MTVTITSVDIGTVAEDGTGDPARTAFDKLNTNDTNLKTAVETLQTTVPAHDQAWTTITSTPTTLAGYGITDAALKTRPIVLGLACSDETTAITTGTGKAEFQIVDGAFTLTGIYATVTTAPTGSTAIIDVNLNGTSIMTTNKISIDATEKTSDTAATQPTLTTTALTENGVITVDFDQVGSTIAGAGVKVYLVGYWT